MLTVRDSVSSAAETRICTRRSGRPLSALVTRPRIIAVPFLSGRESRGGTGGFSRSCTCAAGRRGLPGREGEDGARCHDGFQYLHDHTLPTCIVNTSPGAAPGWLAALDRAGSALWLGRACSGPEGGGAAVSQVCRALGNKLCANAGATRRAGGAAQSSRGPRAGCAACWPFSVIGGISNDSAPDSSGTSRIQLHAGPRGNWSFEMPPITRTASSDSQLESVLRLPSARRGDFSGLRAGLVRPAGRSA